MGQLLIYIVIGLFVAILFVNIYFRIKVIKVYNKLARNKVQFDTSHMMNRKKLESEVLSQHPQHAEDILNFINHIRFSVTIASILFVLIVLVGLILKHSS